jgi:hypothetical protein
MKKLYFIIAIFGFANPVFSQCPANDSTMMGTSTSNDVFYSLANGTVKTISNTNWHLAFSVQRSQFPNNPSSGVAIRVNAGGANMKLVKLPSSQSAANWRSIDTTGLYAMPQLIDSDSNWYMSAFTSGYNPANPFNFIWGNYNMTSKHVVGSSVYVLYNTSNNIYKKIFIPELTFDTMWNVVISNIDNSDSNRIQINKNDYKNKMFVYYNAITNQLEDREPARNTWDLLWTKYLTFVVTSQGSGLYPLSGVFSNPAVSVAKNIGKKCDQVWLINKTAKDNPKISLIGGDWKTFTMGTYRITDTFVYFITANSKTYKLTFKGFVGGSQGKSLFNVYEATLSNKDIVSQAQTNIYPNPTNGQFHIQSDADLISYELFDLKGVKLLSGDPNNQIINISDFQNGVYILSITTDSGKFYSKLIKN